MKNLDGILKLADAELGSIVQNGKFRSRDEIHSAYELIDIAKDIYCIWNYEDESDMRGEAYDGGMSYEREGRSYRGSYDANCNRWAGYANQWGVRVACTAGLK